MRLVGDSNAGCGDVFVLCKFARAVAIDMRSLDRGVTFDAKILLKKGGVSSNEGCVASNCGDADAVRERRIVVTIGVFERWRTCGGDGDLSAVRLPGDIERVELRSLRGLVER